jgi:TonB family protein
LLLALLISQIYVRAEYRYVKLRVGDARILEQQYPVHGVEVVRPEVATTEVDLRHGLVVRAHRRGLAEVSFDRADGKRFHYFVEVRPTTPIRVSLSPLRRTPRVARKRPEERRLRREEEKKPIELAPLPEVKPKGQVVEIPKPAIEQRPDQAKYLSEYDSKVTEEARARQRSLKPAQAIPVPPSPSVQPSRAPQPRPASGPPSSEPRRLARQPAERIPPRALSPEEGKLPKVALAPTPQEPPRESEPKEPEPPGLLRPQSPGVMGGTGGSGPIEIAPRPDVIAQALRGAFPDHLKGIKEGEQTFLNTKAWKGASFFNRVKRAVAHHWNPAQIYRRRDPYGNIYGIRDRYTLVHVTLHTDGSLKNLKVVSPSGVDFLDEEAMGALESAQPFPNPPEEVRDKDGLIRFGFGFYFEISDRPLFRIYRYND